ncbi:MULTISPECIES: carboxymuconolactone decarboxylase family protein [unclassified Streptomyces]|uniref:carboxymuconolactone decarboxylase family protein n=1 Tax=unclassified Streptomyces TaxID=2593676 RepID=UPI003329B7E3
MKDGSADRTATEVMATAELPSARTPFGRASRDFLYGEVWSRPGLSRRDRRWVTLTCVAAADAPEPIEEHVHGALASGDISLAELLEFVLHFAVYCGWPKASHIEGAIARQWDRIHRERSEPTPPWPESAESTLGPSDVEKRLARGVEEFIDVNLTPAPPANSPYRHAGILNFVFGHVWQRPGLTRRERRIITVAGVALDDSPLPLRTHVGAALHSGDLTKEEMDEIVLQFAAYYGFAKGDALADAVEAAWAARPG